MISRILYISQPGEDSNNPHFSVLLKEKDFFVNNWEDPEESRGAWEANKGTAEIYIIVKFLC